MVVMREFVVPAEAAGDRLDVFLARQMRDWSRSQIQHLIREGGVTLDGQRARKAGEEIKSGIRISVCAQRDEPHATPEDLPLDIIYEDADLLVVNKAAGMVVHVGAGVKSGTLVNALLHHIAALSRAGGELRPGIVHRLDKMTSGLVLVAKTDPAHRRLSEQFKAREVRKTYLALVHGRMASDSGQITKPVGRDPVRRTRMKVGGIAARAALTRYRVVRRFRHYSLLEAEPQTGRTHQIRVHLASLGHPVVGDTTYDAPAKLRSEGREEAALPVSPGQVRRTFLHAAKLEFAHPITGVPLQFEAPLPDELAAFLAQLAAREG
jgi:23S rRNA pseudouridine1911/1915/1917 synthase